MRNEIDKMRLKNGEPPPTQEELPTATEGEEWCYYTDHIQRRLREEFANSELSFLKGEVMMKNNYILLSADGDISLYKIDNNIFLNLDEHLEGFYKWKKTSCYDETLFVEYIKKCFGENAMVYCKKVGCVGGRINQYTGKIEDDIEEEYKDIQWYNF